MNPSGFRPTDEEELEKLDKLMEEIGAVKETSYPFTAYSGVSYEKLKEKGRPLSESEKERLKNSGTGKSCEAVMVAEKFKKGQ